MKKILKNIVKNTISILLTQEKGNTISNAIYKFKNRNKWIYRLVYGKVSDEKLFNSILQKLDGKYDILMVHCSLTSMIPMYTGNINKLLDNIIGYCNNKGITLVMPVFFKGSNLEAKKYYENGKNVFDVRKTISGTGLVTEIFRRTKAVKRSIHPTHSVCALGPLADRLTKEHHMGSTSCGKGTPFGEMIKYRTIILGIGTRTSVLTQVHSAEDLMNEKFPLHLYTDTIPVTCLDETGNTIIYNLKIRNPDYIIDPKSFHRILKKMKILEWTYKGIPLFLTQANVVTETITNEARNKRTIYKKINIYN